MKQYRITFYRNMFKQPVAIYYREFETQKELVEWCREILTSSSIYCRYSYGTVTKEEYLKQIEEIQNTQK